jgi:large subunit ribosomal protein L23
MEKTIILKPRMSEKAYGLSQLRNTFVFDVPQTANKHAVARAVAAQFEVEVLAVNLATIKGKAKRTVRKGGRPVAGRTSDVKKAYVTLAKGQSLPFFAAIEEAEAEEAKVQEKVEKVSDKKATDTEAKPARRGLRRIKKEDK